MDCSYLGGPPETSHLYKPLVERVTFLMMILVGEERSSTNIPGSRKIVKVGDSKTRICVLHPSYLLIIGAYNIG